MFAYWIVVVAEKDQSAYTAIDATRQHDQKRNAPRSHHSSFLDLHPPPRLSCLFLAMHSDDPEMHSSEPNSQDDMDADAGRGRTTVSTMPTFKFMPQPRNNIHNTSSHLFARSQQKQIRPPPVPFSLNSSSFRPSTIAPRYRMFRTLLLIVHVLTIRISDRLCL